MHKNAIFPFLHFLLIYLFKWHKVFCVRVTLCHSSVEKIMYLDAIFKEIKNNHKYYVSRIFGVYHEDVNFY